MPDCVFCKIVDGAIPSHSVYKDDRVLAFLDVGPISRGHLLVIPRAHAATLDELGDDDAAAVGRVLPRLSRAVVEATGQSAFNVLQNNGAAAHQAVGHVHFHIIPKHDDGQGLGIGWEPGELDDAERLCQAMQSALTD